jgi:hypothetical protein
MQVVKPGTRGQDDDTLANGILAALLQQPDPLTRYQALSRAQSFYETLARRIAAERARAVAEMHDAGVSYGRIADEIGFTRARAQQLVERAEPPVQSDQQKSTKSTASREHITTFLGRYVASWPRDIGPSPRRPVADSHRAEGIAVDLLGNPEFGALQLGTWLTAPNGGLITAAVDAITPPLYRADIDLLVEAVTLAAKSQQRDARARAAAGALIVAAGAALIVASAKS